MSYWLELFSWEGMGCYSVRQTLKRVMGGKNCRECNVIDNENHRINECKVWEHINLYNVNEKLDFDLIYSENTVHCIKIVERILIMWDLGNGRNTMRCQ